MDIFAQVAQQIIKEQQVIIGPLALDQARGIVGLEISSNGQVTKIATNGKEIIEKLVRQYEKLFGKASLEVCRDAVREIKPPVPQDQLPEILK